MVDVEKILKNIDLLALVGRDVKLAKVASTAGGEWAGECPFCGGRDRLRVQPERGRWWCRQCSDRWRDAIGYVEKRHGVDFKAAVELLGGDHELPPPPARPATPAIEPADQLDVERWRAAGEQLVAEAEAALWAPQGEPARRYLRERRGLDDEGVRAFRMGYVAAERFDELATWGLPPDVNADTGKPRKVWLPRGVLIPCHVDGVLRYIKIRRPDQAAGDGKKIVFVKGGHPALFNADALAGADVVLLVEGEFDAILAHQAGRGRLAAGTLGNAQARLDAARWAPYLLHARRLLVCYDADAAGREHGAKVAGLSARAERVRVPVLRPGDKDITDYWRAGGDVSTWLEGVLGAAELEPMYAEAAKVRKLATQNNDAGRAVVANLPHLVDDTGRAREQAAAAVKSPTVDEVLAGKTADELLRILDVGDLLHHQERELYVKARIELARRETIEQPKTSRPLF